VEKPSNVHFDKVHWGGEREKKVVTGPNTGRAKGGGEIWGMASNGGQVAEKKEGGQKGRPMVFSVFRKGRSLFETRRKTTKKGVSKRVGNGAGVARKKRQRG